MKKSIKKVISIATFCYSLVLFTIDTKAQGNLQFNQVITTSRASAGTVYTVPAGKVFKLESASANASSVVSGRLSSTGFEYSFQSNGSSLSSILLGLASNNTGLWPFPVWLKEGDDITWTPGGTITVYISGIEFNVIP